ncbi:MAG: hypothetical protein E7626_02085 [Ruminococcaceae bacterium]|nr:hypothetical protein [Oscillospiraceae bacterium]
MEKHEDEIMFCKFCGAKHSKTAKFCTVCGKSTGDNIDNTKNEDSFVGVILNKVKNITKKQLIVGLSLILGFIIITSMISYFNSVEYLEKKLTSDYWYQVPEWTDYSERGSVARFYLNGDYKWLGLTKDTSEYWISYHHESPCWEILDDKTLYFDGEYYTWQEEWSLSFDKLVIGDDVYRLSNDWYYDVGWRGTEDIIDYFDRHG